MQRTPTAMTEKTDGLYSHYVLGVLVAAYILSFIDRNVMSILVGPIKADFQITDFQFGLLQGLFFSVFYTFLGLPIGRLADRYNRRWIIAIGVGFWSIMTVACGFAKTFMALAIARMGVGLGEAALSPPAHSLLSDYFSPQRLPMAMAIFTLGITVGGGMAYMVGGWVYTFAANGGFDSWPLLADIKPWKLTFIVIGLPGLLVALLVMTIKEPQRTGFTLANEAQANGSEWPSISTVTTYIFQQKRLYLTLLTAIALLSISGYGYMSWFVEFMIRRFAVERQTIGVNFGLMFIVFGSLGALWGGWFAGWLARKGYTDANMRIVMIVALLWLIPGTVGPLLNHPHYALAMAAPTVFLLNSYFGVAIAALQIVTPNQMRSQVSALLLFMTNLIGFGLGPVLVGFFSDYVFSNSLGLGGALALLTALCCPTAAAFVRYGLPTYRKALKEKRTGHPRI